MNAYATRRRLRAGGEPAVVLMYHRVREIAIEDPFSLTVDPARFAAQLEALRDVAPVVPLADLEQPADHRRLAVTFDDGYLDNLATAFPILEATGTPATIFVTTEIFDGREHWWDRLEHLVGVLDDGSPRPPSVTLAVPGWPRLLVDLRTPAGRVRALQAAAHRLRPLAPDAREAVVEELRVQLGAPAVDRACGHHAGMTADDVARLARSGLVDIGGHTCHHPHLASAPVAVQRAEVLGCRRVLTDVMGRPPAGFAYPFGTWRSYGLPTLRAVREAGFRFACTTEPGTVTAGSRRYEWPRWHVHDWDGEELARRVDGWFRGAA